MAETPLKGKGGGLTAGWETWRTVPGVHRNVPGLPNAPLFSPAVGAGSECGFRGGAAAPAPAAASAAAGGDDASTPRLHGGHLAPEFIAAPASPSSQPAGPSPPATPRSSAALGPTHSLWAFFLRELQWGHSLTWKKPGAPTEHVLNFLRVTLALEPFLTFGHLLCVDLFLFHFTMLPLRCAGALWRLGSLAAASLLRRLGLAAAAAKGGAGGSAAAAAGFTQAQAYDLIKGAIFVAATLALGVVQVSRVYHYIRGEAIIKLCVAQRGPLRAAAAAPPSLTPPLLRFTAPPPPTTPPALAQLRDL